MAANVPNAAAAAVPAVPVAAAKTQAFIQLIVRIYNYNDCATEVVQGLFGLRELIDLVCNWDNDVNLCGAYLTIVQTFLSQHRQ
jgi:hypothetical protein